MDPTELQALKAMYVRLITGQSAREVFDGNSSDRIVFTAANTEQFLKYIQIYDPTFMVTPVNTGRVCPPIGFVFR